MKMTFEGLLKEYVIALQNSDNDRCDQCVRPCHDGICTCGKYNDDEMTQTIRNTAMKLIKDGHDLNHI